MIQMKIYLWTCIPGQQSHERDLRRYLIVNRTPRVLELHLRSEKPMQKGLQSHEHQLALVRTIVLQGQDRQCVVNHGNNGYGKTQMTVHC